jgi:hypothetical protein
MPRYTKCPYFQSEKRQTISCEDVVRRFKTLEAKWIHMDRYCDADYMSCPYAIDLQRAYEQEQKGDIRALDKEKITALQKEHAKLLSALGRAEKRIERQQKKIDDMRAVNKSFTAKYEDLEQKRRAEYAKRRKAEADLKIAQGKVIDELGKLGEIYEQRMAYLIEQFAPDGILVEDDVAAWAGDREFAIVLDADEPHGRYWKVVYKDDKDTDKQAETEE